MSRREPISARAGRDIEYPPSGCTDRTELALSCQDPAATGAGSAGSMHEAVSAKWLRGQTSRNTASFKSTSSAKHAPSMEERLEHSRRQLAEKQAEQAYLLDRNALLEEKLRKLNKQLLSLSSKKRREHDVLTEQGRLLFNETETLTPEAGIAPAAVSISAQQGSSRNRRAAPAEMQRVDVFHQAPESQTASSYDGAAFEQVGDEITEQLDYMPAKLRVIRHVRPKYACPCCRQVVNMSGAPLQPLPNSKATPGLLAHITMAKYVDGLSLSRQERRFSRLGIELSRATMAGWLIELGSKLVVPIVNLLAEQLLSAGLVQMDETRLQVLRSGRAPIADHWMWVRCAGLPKRPVVLFDYDSSQDDRVPECLLTGYKGTLLTDDYEAYEATAAAHGLVHAGCWASARRKFEEACKTQASGKHGEGQACAALDYIEGLYRIEDQLNQRKAGPRAILRTRRTESGTVIGELRAWLNEMAAKVLPQSVLGNAIEYTFRQWPKLIVFLEQPDVPLDNSRCESFIRPFVVGSKAWLFANTPSGATASTNLYSIIATAKANGVEPLAYLTHLYTHLPRAGALDAFEALLPWNAKDVLEKSCPAEAAAAKPNGSSSGKG